MLIAAQTPARAGIATRAALIGAALVLALAVAALAGARYGLLLLVGLGFGSLWKVCGSALPGLGGR